MTDFQRELEFYAKRLPDYDRKSRSNEVFTRWADEYIKAAAAGDKELTECYMAALMLKSWHLVANMYNKVKSIGLYSYEDCITKLYECILIACNYHAWQNPEKHTNAFACVNQTVASRGVAAMFYDSNRDYRKANINLISLDEPIGDDDSTVLGDLLEDTSSMNGLSFETDGADSLVQSLLNQNKIIEAIIADTIAHKDCFKHEKVSKSYISDATGEEVKYSEQYSEFWPYQLVKELNALDDSYTTYFNKRYKIAANKFNVAIEALKAANNQKKYKSIDKTLEALRAIV